MSFTSGSRINPIIIYQMGRVGSQSVVGAIEECGLNTAHIHRLSLASTEIPLSRKESGRRFLRRQVFRAQKGVFMIKIVSAYRDPLKRNVSSFLRNYRRFTSEDPLENDVEKLVETFLSMDRIHRTPATWFDEELLAYTGIDIFSNQFSASAGYSLHQNRNVGLFVVRSDLISRTTVPLAQFIGANKIEIQKLNTSSDYVHDDVATQFHEVFRPPQWMIDMTYRTKSCRHFFSDAEIDAMISGWNH